MFFDLEGNTATRASVQRRLSDKHGRLFSDDMITITGNAACSIARRNAILAGVPKGVWRKAFNECERVIRGDASTLVERRTQAIRYMAHFGLTEAQVFGILDVKGIEDIDLEDLVNLRVIATALKNGEQTVEELLRATQPVAQHAVVVNPLKDEKPASDDGKPAAAAPADKAQPEATPATGKPAEATPADSKPAEEPISQARQRGRDARNLGHSRKAMPPEYRQPDRQADSEQWRLGFDETAPPTTGEAR
jgi:hypothetical protein